jgi:hypothetical protein
MSRRIAWVARFATAVPVLALVILCARTVAAENYNGPTPAMGPAGTSVTIRGDLIGCYANGPGAESSTWGLPNQVVFRWNSNTLKSTDGDAFAQQVQAQKTDTINEPGLQEVASHSFADGQGGWKLTFPATGDPGQHYGVLSFEPHCNYKDTAHPMGIDHHAENIVLAFCVTDAAGNCPDVTSYVPAGTPQGGGYNQVGSHTKGIDILGAQIRRNYITAGICTGLILLVSGGALYLGITGGSVLPAALGGAAAAAPEAGVIIGSGGFTVASTATVTVGETTYSAAQLAAMARWGPSLARIPANLRTAAIALKIMQDGGVPSLVQQAALRGWGFLPMP